MEEPILIGRKCILAYQPIVRRRRTSNVFWSTGLVKMSAQRRAEAFLFSFLRTYYVCSNVTNVCLYISFY